MGFWQKGRIEKGHGPMGIILKSDDNRIVSVTTNKINNVTHFTIAEECDGYFCETYSKERFLAMIEELKQWVINQP